MHFELARSMQSGKPGREIRFAPDFFSHVGFRKRHRESPVFLAKTLG
jgi:hypothetical protein